MKASLRGLLAAGVVLVILGLLGAWRLRSILREMGPDGDGKGSSFEEELLGPKQDPVAADGILDLLLGLEGKTRRTKLLWGTDNQKDESPTPAREQAIESLTTGAEIRRQLAALIQPALETPGDEPILTQMHSYRDFRSLVTGLTDDVLSMFLAGQASEAVDLIARTQEMSRILGRGDLGRSSLIAKMIEISCLGTVDRFTGLALQRHLVPEAALDRLDAVYADTLKREPGIGVSLNSEMDFLERAVKMVDRRLGVLGLLMRLYWGNGVEQVARLRKLTADPDSELSSQEISRMHIMIQIGLPNWRAARNRYRKRLSVRTGVRAAVALEKVRYRTGSYPAAAPAEILDPITSKPFLYRAQGDRWLLYGPDVDGRDDGCNPDKDAVVWQ